MNFVKKIIKKIPPFYRLLTFFGRVNALEDRLSYLEQRVHNYRWHAIELVMDYLVGAQVPGDYCEFGVYKGDTFGHALRYQHVFPDMRYFAFDSFEGLPEPKGIDNLDGYSSNFYKGGFAFGEDEFFANLKSKNVDLSRVQTVKGWFDKTLTDETAKTHQLEKVAAAWIDCDFYESTVPVLNFLTSRLSVGSILIFDDWQVYRNLPDRGQQRACAEWLAQNPNIEIREIFGVSHYGKAFTVSKI